MSLDETIRSGKDEEMPRNKSGEHDTNYPATLHETLQGRLYGKSETKKEKL